MAAYLITSISRFLVDVIGDAPTSGIQVGSRAYSLETSSWFIFDGADWHALTDETVIASMGGDLTGPASAAVLVKIGGQSIALAAPEIDLTNNPTATLILPANPVHSVAGPSTVEYNALVDNFNALLGVVRSIVDRDVLLGLTS